MTRFAERHPRVTLPLLLAHSYMPEWQCRRRELERLITSFLGKVQPTGRKSQPSGRRSKPSVRENEPAGDETPEILK